MILQGDLRVNDQVLRALLEGECQFVVSYENKKRIRVSFHEGTWKLMREDGEYFTFYDSFGVEDCDNPLLRGLIEEKTKSSEGMHWVNEWRDRAAFIMSGVLSIWVSPPEKIAEINVTQACRDGWFNSFND